MPNVSRPCGLQPIEYLTGGGFNGQCRQYYIPSTDGNAYAIGDPVNLAGSADANGVASVVLATAGFGNAILGSIVGMGGIVYGGAGVDPNLPNASIIPATKARGYYVLVADDRDLVFMIQEGGAGAALTAASVGLNFDLVAGTNNGYVSGWLLDNASGNSGATRQVQLLGLLQAPDNALGTYAKWKVRINHHAYAPGQAGV